MRNLVVVFSACSVALASCHADPLEACHAEERAGNYPFNKDNACGCAQRACEAGTRCFQGDCCSPELESANPARCGCLRACTPSEVCTEGACCDPAADSNRASCGCLGPCEKTESCQRREAAGAFACACNPRLNLANRDDCGCSGPCGSLERCRDGVCECDPLSPATAWDDGNCGCRGACPESAYCRDAMCVCRGEDEMLCEAGATAPWGSCRRRDQCTCDPDEHAFDVIDCACHGPCKSGDRCVNRACECDPLLHDGDNNLCGCGRPCDVAGGEECRGGACVCPPERLYDNENCGCLMRCAVGHLCDGGRCVAQ